MNRPKYLLELTVFVCGGAIMVLELVGSRVLGPYFGTSIYVWTSLIGIFLGSLSLGYYWGGKLADKIASLSILSALIMLSGLFIALTIMIKDQVLLILEHSRLGTNGGALISALILFLVPSVLMGMVSPYAAKLKISNLKNTGSSVGNLYALSTLGSIVGTFLAGFYLIPTFGTNKILLILSALLVVLSLLLTARNFLKLKLFTIFLISTLWLAVNLNTSKQLARGFVDLDTAYNRIWIYEGKRAEDGRPVRTMGINAENHSSMFLDSTELVNDYTKYFHLARHFNPRFREALMLGGAGYSFPKDYLRVYPEANLDVVEIDPTVTELAKQHFNLTDNPRLSIYHQDGRVYLNKNSKKYDVIFGDAFSSRNSLPYHLTTHETMERVYSSLSDNGVLLVNVISSIEGDKSLFLRAEYRTIATVFPQLYLFPVESSDPQVLQNIVLVALKSANKVDLNSQDVELSNYLSKVWTKEVPSDLPVLTDDYAPVDYYIGKTL